MIVRTLSQCEKTERRIVSPDGNWESTRMQLQEDNTGFSFHITTIYQGKDFFMHYKNHFESVYCISGKGEIESLAEGKTYPIEPGTLYVLDQHDEHKLRAFEELKLACVFNPPLTGSEVHDQDGSYTLETAPLAS